MAPSTPWLASCAAAVTTGLLALATGTATTPSASPLPQVAARTTATSSTSSTSSHGAGSVTGSRTGTEQAHAALLNLATAASHAGQALTAGSAQTVGDAGATGTAAQRMRLAGAVGSEEVLGRLTSARSGKNVQSLRQTSLNLARGGKKAPAPTPEPSPSPTATATPT
ncbi:MAG: hypothetical protein JWM22_600, partial [Frankiales bacterium]|nr:hypothetical protein [Frankiales bacterium]